MVFAVAVGDAHGGVVGQLPVGDVQTGGPAVEVDAELGAQTEVATDLRTGCLPRHAVEQARGGVAPFAQAGHEYLVAAQAVP